MHVNFAKGKKKALVRVYDKKKYKQSLRKKKNHWMDQGRKNKAGKQFWHAIVEKYIYMTN